MVTVEQILDLLAATLINEPEVNTPMVRQNQKTIRDGLIQLGRDNSERLILFEKLNPATNQFVLDFNLIPGTIPLVSGTTYKVRTVTTLDGQTQVFRLRAQLNDEDALPSARFEKAISQSAFKKGIAIT